MVILFWPQAITAAVYLDLYLFGAHIHVDFEHFPRCHQLKSLLEKFRILHAVAFLPQGGKKITCFYFAFGCWAARNERTADERKRRSPLPARSEALLRVDTGHRYFVRRMNFTRKLQKNQFNHCSL